MTLTKIMWQGARSVKTPPSLSVQIKTHSKSQGHEYHIFLKLVFYDVCADVLLCMYTAFAQQSTPMF